jgi:Glycosyl hydrolase family 1
MITEDGVPDDAGDSGQPTVDHARVEFPEQHLRAVHRAITDGCRVTGYHAWSLLDNIAVCRWGCRSKGSSTANDELGVSALLARSIGLQVADCC